MAGQNFRFNNVTVDGVAQNDNFGLHMNASATQRTPISIDAVEALNVNIAPYDVSYGNFIGGNINIGTKTGGNEFDGGVFATATDDSLTGDESQGDDLGIDEFEEQTYGATLGGPIVQDKLFFFANYEKFDTTRPSNSQSIDNIAGVTQADSLSSLLMCLDHQYKRQRIGIFLGKLRSYEETTAKGFVRLPSGSSLRQAKIRKLEIGTVHNHLEKRYA